MQHAPSSSSTTRDISKIINSRLVYIPIRLGCGCIAQVRPDVLVHCPSVLHDINQDLADCLQLLPRSVRYLILRTRIWVNSSYSYGSLEKPNLVKHTTTHHHHGWLLWAKDNPMKSLGVEIYNASEYQRFRLHWNGCGLMLHELCHLIHQLVFGLDDPIICQEYDRAQASGLYANVRRRDWAGKETDSDLAYCMVNAKEFWAEISVTYWSQGCEELDERDETQILFSSPPFMEPTVIARIQERWPDSAVNKTKTHNSILCLFSRRRPPHCNKFYPYTRGQLQYYDPSAFEVFQALWSEVALWDDPFGPSVCCGGMLLIESRPSSKAALLHY
jgi:hypothetical protein